MGKPMKLPRMIVAKSNGGPFLSSHSLIPIPFWPKAKNNSLEPSRGGMGMRLKIIKTILMDTVMASVVITKVLPGPSHSGNKCFTGIARIAAVMKLDIGPARAINALSLNG